MTGTNWWTSVCMHMPQRSIPFWEGASLEWGKQYALDRSEAVRGGW